jgi:hypothetical protein
VLGVGWPQDPAASPGGKGASIIASKKTIVVVGGIEGRILLVRGEKIIIGAGLAHFYGILAKRLKEQVKRNRQRFPSDFMFRPTAGQKMGVAAICSRLSGLKLSKARPYAFTEDGAIMAVSGGRSHQALVPAEYARMIASGKCPSRATLRHGSEK